MGQARAPGPCRPSRERRSSRGSGRGRACASLRGPPELGRLLSACPLTHEGRAGRRPGGSSALRYQHDLPARAVTCACTRRRAPAARRIRWLDTQESWDWWARCWGFVLRGAGLGPGDRVFFPFSFGLFIGFWVGLRGCARPRLPRHSRGRAGFRPASRRHRGSGRDRDLLHAVVCAAPRRGRARARPGSPQAGRARDRSRGRARRRHPVGARPHRGGPGAPGRTITRA